VSAELDRIREYRRAARAVVRADHAELGERYAALIDLAEAARAEPDPLVATWAQRVIWQESAVFLGVDDGEPDCPPENYERRARALRAEGYERCPRCLSVLATDRDLERWAAMRRAHYEELRVREQAVEQ
jgi:L-alanine-DL-glutamate epimerase-like enolase superfamily enzyme